VRIGRQLQMCIRARTEYTGESGKGSLKTAVLSAAAFTKELSLGAEFGETENAGDGAVNAGNTGRGGGEVDG
ncbi:MAG: hypothetical protein K2N72_02720, partial [Oscillospiraceae bacterium]|nr:hypothetical protein [Oscillospiraceae bacterium]